MIRTLSGSRCHESHSSHSPSVSRPEHAVRFFEEQARTGRMKLLVPINGQEISLWGLTYAFKSHGKGMAVEVTLLNVGEPVTQWEVLRFRTQAEIVRFQAERADAFIAQACESLTAQGISCRGMFRQGEVVFSILDVAEELACDAIVLPRPAGGLMGVFSRGVVNDVVRRHRHIPIVLVDHNGQEVIVVRGQPSE